MSKKTRHAKRGICHSKQYASGGPLTHDKGTAPGPSNRLPIVGVCACDCVAREGRCTSCGGAKR